MSAIERFHELHASGCFVIPNPWDCGSARALVKLGFQAVATTSAGYAWSIGRPDNHITLDDALAHFRVIASSVDVPVNGDFENCFASDPDGVAANVTLAVMTGIAGLSIEDLAGDASSPLYDFDLAVERVRAARRAIDESGARVVLTARTEGMRLNKPDIIETIRRLTAFADVGADCLYAPGLKTREDIVAVVSAVAPRPVNVLVGSDFIKVQELADLGVRRISVGGGLTRVAWGAFLRAAREIAEQGSFTNFRGAAAFDEMDGLFD
jgi:2-methylisocitrate lyase-like PEP mutase family enzyme